MINKNAHLAENIFDTEKLAKASTRVGFGEGVVLLGEKDERIVVLSADLKESTQCGEFEKRFPKRFIEMGVAEQNMATVASGLSAVGKIPFITSYAAFSPGRNYEQIRTTIALNNRPVKICGMHAGLSVGLDGATHQMLEDVAMMRALPNMIVIEASDALEARKAVVAAGSVECPVYLRFGRADVPTYTTEETPFKIGQALTLWESEKPEVALLATGASAYNALLAARALDAIGIGSLVVSFPTIKPLDEDALLDAAKRTKRIVTIEEHQKAGGFGSAVAEYLSSVRPTKITRLGVDNLFGQTGTPSELFAHYGISVDHIIEAGKS